MLQLYFVFASDALSIKPIYAQAVYKYCKFCLINSWFSFEWIMYLEMLVLENILNIKTKH